MDDYHDFQLRSWNRLRAFGLLVEAALIGAKHQFTFEAKRVSVALPDAPMVGRGSKCDDVATCIRWQVTAAGDVPVQYCIEKVDVSVYIPSVLPLPTKILQLPCNAFELLTNEQQTRLNDTANSCGKVAMRAHAYWQDVLRWVTQDGTLARPEPPRPTTGWATYLLDSATNHRLWGETQVIHVRGGTCISTPQWEAMQEILSAQTTVPPYWLYLLEAEHLLDIGDGRRSVIDGALALEAFLRGRLDARLPTTLANRFRDMLQRARLHELLDMRSLAALLGDDGAASLDDSDRTELRRLVDCRNQLMHNAAMPLPARLDIQRWLSITKFLLQTCG